MKFRRKTLWRYIKQKQHKFFWILSIPRPVLPTEQQFKWAEQYYSEEKWRTQDTIIQEETFIGIDKWGHVKDKFRQVTWAWNSDIGQQKWQQMIQRWAETATATEKVQLKIIKYQKATWLPLQYVKWQVLKDKGHTLPPSPQEGLINPHYHTHGATSPQSPSNLQPSTSPALISACSMQGQIYGEGAVGAHPPPLTCSFLIQLVLCKKQNYVVYWCWSRARDKCTPS